VKGTHRGALPCCVFENIDGVGTAAMNRALTRVPVEFVAHMLYDVVGCGDEDEVGGIQHFPGGVVYPAAGYRGGQSPG